MPRKNARPAERKQHALRKAASAKQKVSKYRMRNPDQENFTPEKRLVVMAWIRIHMGDHDDPGPR